MNAKGEGEERDGVALTNLDQPLFDGAGATKRDLVDYLDAVRDRILPVLENRPLSVIRVHRGQEAFMQKNVPKYTPDFVQHRAHVGGDVEARGLLRAVQRPPHACSGSRTNARSSTTRRCSRSTARTASPTSCSTSTHPTPTRSPPSSRSRTSCARRWRRSVSRARSRRAAPRVCTCSCRSTIDAPPEDTAAATRAIAARTERLDPSIATTAFMKEDREGKVFVDSTRAGGATVISAYSPRVRPGVPVSFPVAWADLDDVTPADFTVHTALDLLGDRDPWAAQMPSPQPLSADLVAEGHAIPVARVQAMHEGKRRARQRRE